MDDLYFGSNFNLGYTTTTVSENSLLSSIEPLITSQYVVGFVEHDLTDEKDSLSVSLSQPLSVERGSATFKVPYYYNESSKGFNEKEIDMSIKDRFNNLNIDYIYNFSDTSQLHTGITIGMTNFGALNNPSALVSYELQY